MKKKLNCILLIDDDEPTNFLNKLVIEEIGCAEQVQVVQSGQAALDYLTNSGSFDAGGHTYPRPDLVFLDINMPAMDGWEFLDKYNRLSKAQKGKVIVVMLTTSFNPDDEMKAKSIDAISDFKSKPLTVEVLRAILGEHFPQCL